MAQSIQNINQLSQSYVTAGPFLDQNGNAYTPTSLRYRIDDLTNNVQIQDWTTLAVDSTVTIIIPSATNELTDINNVVEMRQVTLEVTAPGGALRYDDVTYNLIKVHGLT